MTITEQKEREKSAIKWHVLLRIAGAAEWEAFEAWLNADQRNLAAYEAVAALDQVLDIALVGPAEPAVSASNENERTASRSRRWWIGGGLAAGVAAGIVFLGLPRGTHTSRYDIATAAGEQRALDLGDGTRIVLNGDSRVALDRSNPRFAALEKGEATFKVRHDPANPFTLELGQVRVRDTGTVFNVIREANGDTVEVQSGSIVYDTNTDSVPVKAGQSLRTVGTSSIVVSPKRPEDIASWQEGRLEYDMQTFADIAKDLTRNLGAPVMADPALAERRFTGTIMLDRDHRRFFARLAVLLGIQVKRDGASWRMSAH